MKKKEKKQKKAKSAFLVPFVPKKFYTPCPSGSAAAVTQQPVQRAF